MQVRVSCGRPPSSFLLPLSFYVAAAPLRRWFRFLLPSFVFVRYCALLLFPPPPSVCVGEGVEEGRPYGPGLPGFVPTLVLVYGVSRIEKCVVYTRAEIHTPRI